MHPKNCASTRPTGSPPTDRLPMLVVLPSTVEQVSAILAYCHANGVKVVPRGAGTSLSGGALPVADGIVLGMAKFNRILAIDYDNRCVVAQTGVTNLAITEAVAGQGFYYAPDPSSQIACTIGGNVAENSGGVHCLKYGLTTNNVLGLEMVLPTGEVLRLGGKHLDAEGYDLLGLMIGSEGLLGVVTEVTVRILQRAECARAVLLGFPSSEAAGACVAAIIGAGIIPGGMEMMDKPAIHAAEDFVQCRLPSRCRSAADRRTGRAECRSRSSPGIGGTDRRRDKAPTTCASAAPMRSGRSSGPDARRPFQPSAAFHPTTTAWTEQSRARDCPKCCIGCRRCLSRYGLQGRQCVPCRRRQPASA